MPEEREAYMCIELEFKTVSRLEKWLNQKNFESGTPEAYDTWLQDFFKSNTITVAGEEYDYWACWELI